MYELNKNTKFYKKTWASHQQYPYLELPKEYAEDWQFSELFDSISEYDRYEKMEQNTTVHLFFPYGDNVRQEPIYIIEIAPRRKNGRTVMVFDRTDPEQCRPLYGDIEEWFMDYSSSGYKSLGEVFDEALLSFALYFTRTTLGHLRDANEIVAHFTGYTKYHRKDLIVAHFTEKFKQQNLSDELSESLAYHLGLSLWQSRSACDLNTTYHQLVKSGEIKVYGKHKELSVSLL